MAQMSLKKDLFLVPNGSQRLSLISVKERLPEPKQGVFSL